MVDESMPSFDEMAAALSKAEPLQIELTAYEAYTLVAFLQLGARMLGDEHESVGYARAIAVAVGQRLAEVCPITALTIAAGWNPEFDVDINASYWAALTPESPLREAFENSVAPILHPFTITSEAAGAHYIIDSERLTPKESESLALYLKKLWNSHGFFDTDHIEEDILKGLPVRASHFTGEIVTSPKETA